MNLRELRKQRGLTMEAVSYMTGLDQATISRIERGLVKPRPSTAVGIARAFGISLDRFDRLVSEQDT